MSERKGINRYYPPGVDPSKVRFSQKQPKKGKDGRSKAQSVRLMAPFSMKCLKCNEYIAQSRKFNARKETTDRDYLGIKIIRFNVRCPRCYSELIFETDPKNGDYQCLNGCKKNYEKPKDIKVNESIDEMILRLEKEVKEDERLKELEQKGGKNKRNGLTSEETGMEQLEKRLTEQQKEKERVEELEDLHDIMNNLERKRVQFEDLDNNNKKNSNQNHKDDDDDYDYFDIEAKKAFEEFSKSKLEKEKKNQTGLAFDYSSSSASEDNDDNESVDESRVKCLKRTTKPLNGVTKRRKIKIIT